MSAPAGFCTGCGAPRRPGKRFCGVCGARFESDVPPSSDPTVKGAVDAGASAVRSVERAVSTAQSVANVAGQVSRFEIGPPAEWKVVVGDALPAVGDVLVDRAIGAVAAGVKDAVVSRTEQTIEGMIAPDTATPPPAGPRCPACGAATTHGKRFCRACGASLAPSPSPPPSTLTCPSCGDPVGPNEKFCGVCGVRLR